MDNRTLLRTGIAGSVVAALCCATPLLAILLGVVGLSAWIGGLDYVVIPALVMFLGITIDALRRRRAEAACCVPPVNADANTPEGRQ
jgi:mercuric ion transport protein